MAKPEPESQDVFDIDRIRRLVELMQEFDLREIDLEQSDRSITLKRGTKPEAVSYMAPMMAPPPMSAPSRPAEPAPAKEAPPAEPKNVTLIKSPMVGTFYSKPNPDAPTFVKVGDHVNPDTTICIIEAMKVFNEIKAEISGQIVAMLVDNEDAVEFGKPLFKVDTGK